MPSLRTVLIGLAVVLAAAWAAATIRFVLAPDEDEPAHAGAVVVLSGSKGERLDRGLELVRAGVAPVLVISGGLDARQPRANRLCAAGRGDGFRVLCFTPDPDSTRGEAREVARLATRNGWDSVLLVTTRFHVTRARLLFGRCVDAEVYATGIPYAWWRIPEAVVGEWLKGAYSLALARGC